MPRQKAGRIEAGLDDGRREEALSQLLPGEAFYLAAEYRRRFPDENGEWEAAGEELDSLARRYPQEVSWGRVARDLDVPHPALARHSRLSHPRLKPFPT